MMSLSLVKIVLVYLVHPTASPGSTPEPLLAIGEQGNEDGQFSSPVYSIACSPDGNIWTACKNQVQVFSHEGKFLYHCAKRQWKDASGVALAADGQAYVCDYETHNIVVCRDGRLVKRIGSYGSGNDLEFIAIDNKARLIFVGDYYNHRVVVLKLDDCSFVRAIGSYGRDAGQISYPRGIALSREGDVPLVAVAEHGNDRISVFTYDGKFLRTFGSAGIAPGEIANPFGLAVDSAGHWLVADHGNTRIQVFTADGSFYTEFGDETSGPTHLSSVRDVILDSDGRILVADSCRVAVFGYFLKD